MTSAYKLSEQINNLWQKHLPLMKSRIETIQLAVTGLQEGRLPQDIRVASKQAAHKLAGSLGTFGLEAASSEASEIEQLLTDELSAANATELSQRLTRIKQAIDQRGCDSSTVRA